MRHEECKVEQKKRKRSWSNLRWCLGGNNRLQALLLALLSRRRRTIGVGIGIGGCWLQWLLCDDVLGLLSAVHDGLCGMCKLECEVSSGSGSVGDRLGGQVELEGPDWQFEGGSARRCDGLGLVMLRPVGEQSELGYPIAAQRLEAAVRSVNPLFPSVMASLAPRLVWYQTT
ncbi:hypothetical protein BDP81DRAFT_10450 [Colletotrichum phormii]|uniref:Uncharacterized protein n=1 Tax=Colletotrichum phormii TaxID=359342 RepID=A0AAJ0A3I0_9PEZI|nr:uncharacterized protein BDP81DRAFT_10450 [Colletotrichum phormii]KAK1655809.1 hypothetical protein BDP81DRAFT_10450 [Colletotrichum phormii]